MKILYFHQYFHTPDMNGSTRSYEFAKRLVKNGHEVHVVSSWRFGGKSRLFNYENIEGIHVHWISVLYSNELGFVRRLFAFLKFAILAFYKGLVISSDVVFATSAPLTIAIPSVLVSKIKRKPLVFEIRDVWPLVPIEMGILKSPIAIALARRLEKIAYFSSSAVITVAPGMKDEVAKTGYPLDKIVVVPHGCDSDLFHVDNGSAVAGDEQSVLYIGTLGKANGVDYIVHLAAAVLKLYPESRLKFLIIGEGKESAAIQRLAQDKGVLDRNVFFLGSMPKRELVDYLERSSATLMTYAGPEVVYRDSVSNKFFDSIAARKPVFANFSGFSSLVSQHFGAGFILPEDSYEDAAHYMVNKLAEKHFVDDTAKACELLVKDYFSRDKLAVDFESVLDHVYRREPVDSAVGKSYEDLWADLYDKEAPTRH